MSAITQLTTPSPSSTHPFATASTTFAACTWTGHCLGASCLSNDDCDNDWICSNKICSPCCETLSHSSVVVTQTTTATASATSSNTPSNVSDGGLGTTATIGIGVGAGVLVILFVGIGLWLCRRKRPRKVFEAPDTQHMRTELDGTDQHTADGERKRAFAAPTAELASDAAPGELHAVELVELDASAESEWEHQQEEGREHEWEQQQEWEQEWEQEQGGQEYGWDQQQKRQESEWRPEQERHTQFEEVQFSAVRKESGSSTPRPDQMSNFTSRQAQFETHAVSPYQHSVAQWPASPVSPEEHQSHTPQNRTYAYYTRPAIPRQEASPQQSYVAYRPPEAQRLSPGHMSDRGSTQTEAEREEAAFFTPSEQPNWPLANTEAQDYLPHRNRGPSRELPRSAASTPFQHREDVDPFLQWPAQPQR